MLKFFVDSYYLMHPLVEKPILQRFRIYSLGRFLVRLLANMLMPLYYKLTSNKCYATDANSEFVLTMTSFPLRIDKVWLSVETLLRQTYRPKEIWLWLSKEQFPNAYDDLPKNLLAQQNRGLKIVFIEHDYRSHKKYYTILQQQPNATIVTVDDDIFYEPSLLFRLLKEHQQHPHDVIAAYVHQMRYVEDGRVLPYSQWKFHSTGSEHLFFGSGGGTCFPAGCFYKDVCDISTAVDLCPIADDLWLNAQVRLAATPIRRLPAKKPFRSITIMRFHNAELCDDNIEHGTQNDEQLQRLISYYETTEGRNPFALCVE